MDVSGFKIPEKKKNAPVTKEHELATEIWEHGGKAKPFMSVYMQVKRLGYSLAMSKWKGCIDSESRVKCFMYNEKYDNNS